MRKPYLDDQMQHLLESIHLRYALAILISAMLMIWQSMDAVRNGASLDGHALFWSLSITAGWLQMIIIARGVRTTLGVDQYPGWALLAVSALIGAVPLTFQVRWMMQTIVMPEYGLPAPWVTYLNVTLICVVCGLIQYLLVERWSLFASADPSIKSDPNRAKEKAEPESEVFETITNSTQSPEFASPAVTLLSRRPEGLAGNILYLRMEDHYLRVCTEKGSAMILHRMSDAASDLSRTNGLQVHKSWWVSRDAVKEFRRRSRARSIVTHDGAEIPIGR